MDQWSVPSITQLINPIRASYQDANNCQRQERHEHLEARWQWSYPWLDTLRPNIADRELHPESYEDAKREDLEGETRDGDVVCLCATSVGGR